MTAPTVDPALVRAGSALLQQLRIQPVGQQAIRDTLQVPGQVQVDEQRVARIGSTVTGRITSVQASLGDRVSRGAVLATVNSTELAQAQLAYLKALAVHQLRLKEVERARMLLAGDVIGSAELQRRENELLSAEVERSASEDQLRVLGMSRAAVQRLAASRRVDSMSHVTSTLAGIVIERNVTPGQVVQPADAAFTVADLSHVWVVADVPEQAAGLIQVGKEVQIEIPALQGKRFTGRLIYVADVVKPDTRTVTVRTDLENPDGAIKPAMLANMLIQARPVPHLVVPAQAVVREENKDYVFVEVGPAQFRLRPVTLGPDHAGLRPVLDGLSEGERVVIEGAFHLNNERRRQELE